jgi:hypothetical protein
MTLLKYKTNIILTLLLIASLALNYAQREIIQEPVIKAFISALPVLKEELTQCQDKFEGECKLHFLPSKKVAQSYQEKKLSTPNLTISP